jgi:hypothetical protein
MQIMYLQQASVLFTLFCTSQFRFGQSSANGNGYFYPELLANNPVCRAKFGQVHNTGHGRSFLRSRGGSVGLVTGQARNQFLATTRDVSRLYSVQNRTKAYTTSYPVAWQLSLR